MEGGRVGWRIPFITRIGFEKKEKKKKREEKGRKRRQ